MEYVCIGKIITTHGLNGEMKLRSNFKYKNKVFKKGMLIYIGSKKEEHKILSYRTHKDYDMVILSDINDIEKAIEYKQELVYVLKEDIIFLNDEYLDEDLVGFDAYFNDKKIGVIKEVTDQGNNNIVILLDNLKYIPKNEHFILKIDFLKKEIYFKNLEGLL